MVMILLFSPQTRKKSFFYCLPLKALSCTKSNNFYVEYSIGYAIGKSKAIIRSNTRCTDHDYIHFF